MSSVFGDVGAVRLDPTKSTSGLVPIEVELLVDKKPKKFRKTLSDPSYKLLDRIKLVQAQTLNGGPVLKKPKLNQSDQNLGEKL